MNAFLSFSESVSPSSGEFLRFLYCSSVKVTKIFFLVDVSMITYIYLRDYK